MDRPFSARFARWIGAAGALALVVWALRSPQYFNADGYPSGALPIVIGAALGLLVAGLAAPTALGESAFWFGLLLVGQSASLAVMDAGRRIHYEHLVGWKTLLTAHPIAALVLAAQVTLVAAALVSKRRQLMRSAQLIANRWRWLLLAAAFVASSATVSQAPQDYAKELLLATLLQATALGTIVLALSALPASSVERVGARLRSILDSPRSGKRIDPFVASVAGFATIASALLSLVIYQRHPHLQDEVAYVLQARYLAAGHLTMTPPAVPSAFELYLFDVGPRGWFSVVPLGWPLVLAVGEFLGAAWLVNPTLAGVNILLVYPLVTHLYDRKTARLTTVLMALSPWYLYLGMSFMPHMVTLTCLLLGALSVVHARRTGAWWMTWFGGAAIGLLTLVRQLDGFVAAIALGLWSLGLGGRRLSAPAIAGLVGGTVLVGALTLPYNAYFTGSATTFPMMVHTDRLFGVNSNAYGFGKDRGMGWALDPHPGHGPVDATINADLNATTMSTELLGWCTGSLLLAYLALVRGHLNRSDWLLVAFAAGIFVVYFFNYFSGGPDFGPRYWFLMILPAIVLTVRGVHVVARAFGRLFERDVENRMVIGVLSLSLAAAVTFLPWRAVDKYHDYLNMRPDLREIAADRAFAHGLVLIRGKEFPDYASAAVYNPLDVRSPGTIFARDRSADARADLLRAYSDRSVWIIDGPSVTGAGYHVVAGPLPATDPDALVAAEEGN